jgi:zinc protease
MWQKGFLCPFGRQGFGLAKTLSLVAAFAVSPANAMDIKRVTSPGGIEAWLVESHANPLIAMRFAFRRTSRASPILYQA